MSKHLSESDRAGVVGILDGWPTDRKLTWGRLIESIEERLGIRPTRQTLARHRDILLAFRSRKEGIGRPGPKTESERVLAERVERLEAEKLRLSKEKALLYEQFARWQYNAHKHGLTEEALNEPLPRIHRRRAD